MPKGPEGVALDAVRADGWLARLLEGDPALAEVAEVVGGAFVAFAFVAGVRITGLDGELDAPESTLVDFRVGDEPTEQRLGLSEFRRRLAAALLADEPFAFPPPRKGATTEDLQQFFGPQLLLLAPVFGHSLESLRVVGGRALVRVRPIPPEGRLARGLGGGDGPSPGGEASGGEAREVPLEELRERVRDGVQTEVERVRATSAFSIDLGVLPEAEAAAAEGRPKRAIALLGAWPGPLTMLLRTPQGAALAPDVRMTLARALGVLGTAYVATGRFGWAEEVLRLGVQFVQEGAAAGDLYRRLGECFAAQDRFGEAIGPLRRAVALGVEERAVLPALARAYAARRRLVAAAVCAERAIARGVEEAAMQALLASAAGELGRAWSDFRGRFEGPAPRAPVSLFPDERVTPPVPIPAAAAAAAVADPARGPARAEELDPAEDPALDLDPGPDAAERPD